VYDPSDALGRLPKAVPGVGRWRCVAAVCLLGALCFGWPVRADDRDDEIAALKARLERLEKGAERPAGDSSKTGEGSPAPAGGDAKSQPGKKAEAGEGEQKKAADPTKFDGGLWRNGLQFEGPGKAFRVHVGGRMHVDAAWWEAPNRVMFGPGGVGPLEDGAAFRRARLRVTGTIYENVNFFTEYGFETGEPQFFDVFGEVTGLPYAGAVRVGHFREPFSMYALTSGDSLTLMERSLIQDAFVPFRNTGVMTYNAILDERATWAVGVFRAFSDAVGADGGDGDYAVTGRATVNPWYADDGAYALHLGVAGSHRDLPDLNPQGAPVDAEGRERGRFATRPEIRPNAPNFANTGFLAADSLQLLGLEMGLGLSRVLIQSEYVFAFVSDAGLPVPTGLPPRTGDLFFHGGYVQASYFLTGESRPYVRRQGVFGQVVPHENFVSTAGNCCGQICGCGAWEVAARYSFLDLDDRGVTGGELHDLTLGLNWYLNPNTRVMWNYILAWRDAAGGGSDGLTQILAARFQVDF
jgi:phosphate-selective porin OprO/OprP